MDEATQRQLQARADKGLPVSFIDDVPEIPNDVVDVYRAFAELRAMTPADAPVSYPDLRLAWEVNVADGVFDDESGIDFPVFARMIASMDNVFGKRQMERMKKEINKNKSNQESARKAAEEKARRRSSEVNAKIGPSKGASRTKH